MPSLSLAVAVAEPGSPAVAFAPVTSVAHAFAPAPAPAPVASAPTPSAAAVDAALVPEPVPSESGCCDGQLTEMVTRLRRALRTSLRAEYTWESLPMTHVEILHTLAEQPGIRISTVAVELRLAQSTVSGLIRQMADDGLVERTRALADRRVVLLSLTAAGAGQLAGWQEAHRRRISAALNRLATDEQFAIGQALPALDLLVDELNEMNEMNDLTGL